MTSECPEFYLWYSDGIRRLGLRFMKFILGRKLNMSSRFTASGTKIPVTAIEVGPCKVVQVKNQE